MNPHTKFQRNQAIQNWAKAI